MRTRQKVRILLAPLLISISLTAVPQENGPARKPYVEPGDRWVYRATGYQREGFERFQVSVTFVNEKTIYAVYTGNDGKEADTTWTREWNILIDPDGIIFQPSSLTFRFPIKTGDSREYEFETLRTRAGYPTINSRKSWVDGWEDVEVPAGKFRAMKIRIEGSTRRKDTQAPVATSGAELWYVPDVERWVKAVYRFPSYTRTEELVEFKLNK